MMVGPTAIENAVSTACDELFSGDCFRLDRHKETLRIPWQSPNESSHEQERIMASSMTRSGAEGTSRANKPRTGRTVVESTTDSTIRFSATLFRPDAAGKAVDWTFLKLPKDASAKLPSRGMVSVEGTFHGLAYRGTLEPDGQGGHWLKVERELREAAGAEPGDVVSLEIAPATEEPEPVVPDDLRNALAAAQAKVRAVWSDITPVARRDWIQWIESAKREATRLKRIENACDMLAKGKRRPCCFDRSGMYAKSASCPVADDPSGDTKR
jgi:hypothetical protein